MIQVYDRKRGVMIDETVPNDMSLIMLYHSRYGRGLLYLLFRKKILTDMIGKRMKSAGSAKRIKPFIQKYNIDELEFESPVSAFNNFNDFFIRKLRSGARLFEGSDQTLCSPCDGRLKAWENIETDFLCQFKGLEYSLTRLLGDEELASEYEGGTCLTFRLSPTDYHRYHFIDDGVCSPSQTVNGKYYSVNPIALEKIKDIYVSNKRSMSVFDSAHFGKVIIVEVGATAVGSICNTYEPNTRVSRGMEKGYFEFGGSTILLFFKKNTVKIAEDILNYTQNEIECKVKAGEWIGTKL